MEFTIEDIIKSYDKYGNLKDAAKALGTSRSTLQRRFKAEGYFYDPLLKKYFLKGNVLSENLEDKSLEDESLVPGSYTIPESLAIALKFKAVVEKKKVVDIVRTAIEDAVEDKYIDLTKNV